MRLFETLILATIFPQVVGLFFAAAARPAWLVWLPVVTAVFLLLHLWREGYRWQMVPAYLLLIILWIMAISPILSQPTQIAVGWRMFAAILGVVAFVTAVTLPTLFPIFHLPAPTGAYSVGTTHFTVTGERDVIVQAWYPAAERNGKRSPYLATRQFPWDWLRLVRTQAYLNAPPSPEQAACPVLIFNHGGGFIAVQNSIQIQELASHGYAVFSLSHPLDSAVTVYPDGQTDGRFLWQAWRDMEPVLNDNNKAATTAKALRHSEGGDKLSLAEKKAIMQQVFVENKVALKVIERRVADTIAVIDYLEKLSKDAAGHLLAGKLDLARLGIFGHSNGGAVAVNAAMKDARINAVINMDGYLFGNVFNSGLPQPFMSMNKEGGQGGDDVIVEQAKTKAYLLTIQGASHFNFMDIYLWVPLLNGRFLGSIAPQRAVEIINRYTLAFFDKHLKGKTVPLLDSSSADYPEVLFESRGVEDS